MDAEMFSRMMQVLESKASVFSKIVDADARAKTVGEKGGGGKGGSKEGGAGSGPVSMKESSFAPKKDIHKQLDDILKVLKQISYNTSGMDDYLESLGFKAEQSAKL